MTKRRIVQFGTKKNNILPFLNYPTLTGWEDSWSDESDISEKELVFTDGSFRNLGFDRSRRKGKNIIKRFTIKFDCKSYNASYIHDYILKVLNSGVQKLIAQREDGTYMWIYAEAVAKGYTRNFNDKLDELNFSIEFKANCPYWRSIRTGEIGYWNICSICDILDIVNCSGDNFSKFEFNYLLNQAPFECDTSLNILIEDETLGLASGCKSGCITDNSLIKKFGDLKTNTNSTECITASAGIDYSITFLNSWTNPTVNAGIDIIKYNGNLVTGQYLKIETGPFNGDVSSLNVETNIIGFVKSNIEITKFDQYGKINVLVTGKNTDGLISFNIINKYTN